MASFTAPINLRFMGFCGVDDSVDPELLQLLSVHYPWIEWGVLFRPDMEGTPRYATEDWVKKLISVNTESGNLMHLAGHLCGSRCLSVMNGDFSFVKALSQMGFGRVQINATKMNNVILQQGVGQNEKYASQLRKCIESVPSMEYILQYNDETKPIIDLLINLKQPPKNMSVLYDASCGTGELASSYKSPLSNIKTGYAGGIGPDTIDSVLMNVSSAAGNIPVWVDMESSLRLKVVVGDGFLDTFSIDKCFKCILTGLQYGCPSSRFTLLSI